MLVSALLLQQGFDVDQAEDGEAAVRAAQAHALDLIVLDIGLPDIDGVEVCRRVRAFSDAHVLMLTAQDTELDKVVGFEAGADDYVTKPFSVAELVGRVKAVLRRAGGGTTRTTPREPENPAPDVRHAHARPARPRGHPRRHRARADADRVRPAGHAHRAAARRVQPRPAAGAGLGRELVRRQPPGRCPHLQPAAQAAGRPAVAGFRRHRPRCRVPDGRRPVTAVLPPLTLPEVARGRGPRLRPRRGHPQRQ